MNDYLNDTELNQFLKFLSLKKISKSEFGRWCGTSAQAAIASFKRKRIKRLVAREFVRERKEAALIGFAEVEF